jgi:hypothetical protein
MKEITVFLQLIFFFLDYCDLYKKKLYLCTVFKCIIYIQYNIVHG